MHRRDVFLLCLCAACQVRAQPAAEALAAQLRAGRCVVLWRHAQTTPGVGDPLGFRLGDCASQRNLSAEGRDQARAAGEWFKARSLRPAGVRSSAWCRCRDTADLAFGSHVHWAPLDSTFGRAGEPDGRRQALLDRLAAMPAGSFEVWVTHQVNIGAFTGESVAMGEAVIVEAGGRVIGRSSFG
ncbi:histidine phosphatase family protein [Variovorax saccharolyticus]|uniref:histidine phosphatase family protein n=1 Tax=Variovorax saccharolyticus TaxID=3053516 RepID=UPI00257504D1|nr:histidine phosphatase family protein [Variovorax sp. J22R187]MDM0019415.1 histidine phosphatase family protein [Variovorax sp. J22R187]